MRRNALIVLALITVAVAAAAMLARTDTSTIERSGELVFPSLMERINDTVTVVGTSAGESFTLKRADGRWVISERFDYPAADDARKLLIGVARLERIEPKTSNPDLYSKLGLDEVTDKQSSSIRYVLEDTGGATLADIIIGDNRPARGDPEANEYYVRQPGDPQSWLVKGNLPERANAVEWLDDRVLSLDRERVRRVTVRHADGEEVVVRKPKPSMQDFELVDMPEGAGIDGEWKLNDMGRALADFELDDVMLASETTFAEGGFEVDLVTFDGLRVRLQSAKDGDRTLARLEAAFDEPLVTQEFFDVEAEAEKLRSAEEVRKEAAELNERWRDWVYVVPSYRAGYLSKRRDELIKFPESKQQDEPQSGG